MASLTQLRYALAVDTHRSFSRAARACAISQPTLSGQLAKLEDELELKLFDRSKKPIVPTADGIPLLAQFRQVMLEYERAMELAQELNGGVAGEYRLGIIPTMAPTILPRLLPTFAQRFPEVTLRVEELTTDAIIGRLNEESLDGGILATPLKDSRIAELPLFQEDFVVVHPSAVSVCTDRHGRAALRDLPLQSLLVMKEGHCLRTQVLDLCEYGREAELERRFQLEAGSLSTLLQMVRREGYVTVLPRLAAEDLANFPDLSVTEIAGPLPYREVALVSSRRGLRRAIRDALADTARELLQPVKKSRRKRQAKARPPR